MQQIDAASIQTSADTLYSTGTNLPKPDAVGDKRLSSLLCT
jgi:hypothetical protein